MAYESLQYAYCEPTWGGVFRTLHIRRLTAAGLMPGGGIDTDPLCGRVLDGNGWDIDTPVVLAQAVGWAKRTNPGGGADTCPRCVVVLAVVLAKEGSG